MRERIQSSTESAANFCRFLIFWHQDAVGTVEGRKLPLFVNYLPAQYLPKRTARIHEEKLAILFWYISKAIHGASPSRQGRGIWHSGARPFTNAACRTRPTALAQIAQRMDRLALLTKKLLLPAQLPAPFHYHRFSCH
jgi:hypothetical protein